MLQRVLVSLDARANEAGHYFGRRCDRVAMRGDAVTHRVDAEIRIGERRHRVVGGRGEADIGIVGEAGDRFRALGQEGLVAGAAVGRHDPNRRAVDLVLRQQRIEHGRRRVALQGRNHLADQIRRLGDVLVLPANQGVRADLVELCHRAHRHALRGAKHQRRRIDDGESVLLAGDELHRGRDASAFEHLNVEALVAVEALVDTEQIRRAVAVVIESEAHRDLGQSLGKGQRTGETERAGGNARSQEGTTRKAVHLDPLSNTSSAHRDVRRDGGHAPPARQSAASPWFPACAGTADRLRRSPRSAPAAAS